MKSKVAVDVNTGMNIVCKHYSGEFDRFGKAIWRDGNGFAYELRYSSYCGMWFFQKNSEYDDVPGTIKLTVFGGNR